ncbi:MAG: hypothetical protein IKT12_05235, partial [Thermoguttaceae bacterium]|nr:hypothetical protein [Thermoguttaceae bacterium]
MRQRKLSTADIFYAGLFGVLALFFLRGNLRAEDENVLFFDEEPAVETASADAPAVPAESETAADAPAVPTESETATETQTEPSTPSQTDTDAESAETVTAEKPTPKPEIEAAIR